MTIIKIIDLFTFYGIDVIVLSIICTILTQVLKSTLLKKFKRKLMTFLPFVLGIIIFASYAALKNLSFVYLLENYVYVLEHGISVGAVATFLYVFYEQFVREEHSTESEKIIATLIEGYVPSENVQKAAKEIASAIERDVLGNGATRATEILKSFGEDLSENDIVLLSRLILETLAHIDSK